MTYIEIIRTAPPKKQVAHKVGNFYRNSENHGLYQLTEGFDKTVTLIEIETGLLWDGVDVGGFPNVTDEEFDLLVGHHPTLFDYVEKVQITYELA